MTQGTVLVVGTVGPSWDSLVERLMRDRFSVLTVENVTDALGQLRRKHVDVMVTDYRLNGGTADELVAKATAEGTQVPYVVRSDVADTRKACRMIQRGAVGCVSADETCLDDVVAVAETVVRPKRRRRLLAWLPILFAAGLALVATAHVWQLQKAALVGQTRTEQRELLLGLLQHATQAVITLDCREKVTVWSPGAEDLFGWSEEEMLGQTVDRIIPEERLATHRKGLARVAKRNKVSPVYLVKAFGKHRDGALVPIVVYARAIPNHVGMCYIALISPAEETRQTTVKPPAGRIVPATSPERVEQRAQRASQVQW